ncbi:MAG: dihydrofolate reductase family protein [Acidobacteria bacterium]|nr:dihydrofolate reductase family protein [Acidobacteriota bacterium]
MPVERCFNNSEDLFPLPENMKELYGPFGFPAARDNSRPYISSNFVMGLDGRVSFRELAGQAGGREVSRSADDLWLMNFLRAHHDAQIMGASTLRDEPGPDGWGWSYAIKDEQLRSYRQDTLRLGRQRVLILSGSGDIDLNFRVFRSSEVEPWIVTASAGATNIEARLQKLGRKGTVKIVAVGDGSIVDISQAVRLLRAEHGIDTLLCEGGPSLYGEMLKEDLVDEEFRTISLQVLGTSTKPDLQRPTPYGNSSFTPETAPWFRLISLHYALPYHAFFRLRYEGPRRFQPPRDVASGRPGKG